MDQGKREKRLVTNTLILSIGTVFSSVFSFFVVPLYSRWLSAADYGIYDLFVTYISLLQPVITLSCGEACFRFLLERKEEEGKNSIVSNSFTISCVGVIIGSIVLAILFVVGKRAYLIPFVCLLISSTVFSQCGYIVRGIRRPEVYTFSNIIYLVLMAVSVTIFVYYIKIGVFGILLGSSIGYCFGSIYAICSCKIWKCLSVFTVKKRVMKELIKYSAPLIPNTISWWIVGVSDRFLVSILLGPAVNGIYAIAAKMPSLCTTIFSVFHMSWQESASDAINDTDRSMYFNNVLNHVIPLCLCICMCVLSINRYMYRWIWDLKYIGGYYHVPILITAAAFSFFAQFLGGVLVALKKTKVNGSTTVIAAIVNIIVNFFFIRVIGLYAASLSTLVSYLVLFSIRVVLIREDFAIKVNKRVLLSIILYVIAIAAQFIQSEIIGIAAILYSVIASLFLNKDFVFGVLIKIHNRK